MTLMARGMTWLNARLDTSAAESVRVIRGSSVLADVWLATPSTVQPESLSEADATIVSDRRDWTGDPSEWRLEGVTVKPIRGDLIEWEHPDETLVFEVLPADGEDVWAPVGPFENRIRVHTKLTERRPRI